MKKILATVLAFALALSFTACGRKNDESSLPESMPSQPDSTVSDVTLTVWGPQAEVGEKGSGWLPLWCEKFAQEHPEWNLTFTYEVCGEGDAGNNVTKDPTAAGDIYFFSSDQLGTLLQANAIARLGGETLSAVTADNSEEILATVSQDGAVYGAPFTANTWFLYYDKSVFTEEDVKSLDKMLAVAEEKGVKVSFPLTTGWYFGSFYVANGGTFFGDGTDASQGIRFGGENGAAVTRYLVDLVKHPAFLNDAGGAGLSGLADGTVKAYFSGTWDAAAVQEALGENWAAAIPPSITIDGAQKQLMSFGGTKAIAVNPNTAHPQAAAALAAFLASPEAQLAHFEFNGTSPVSVSLMANNSDIAANPAVRTAIDTVESAAIPQPSLPEMSVYWTSAEAMANAIYNGEVTHQNAAEKTEAFHNDLNNPGL